MEEDDFLTKLLVMSFVGSMYQNLSIRASHLVNGVEEK